MSKGSHRQEGATGRRTPWALLALLGIAIAAGLVAVGVAAAGPEDTSTAAPAPIPSSPAAPAPTVDAAPDGVAPASPAPASPAPGARDVPSGPPAPEVAAVQARVDAVVAETPLLFEPDTDVPTDATVRALRRVADLMAEAPGTELTVIGHVFRATPPSPPRGQLLSEARAAAAVMCLEESGVPADRMSAVGAGPTDPGTPADASRRVDLEVT